MSTKFYRPTPVVTLGAAQTFRARLRTPEMRPRAGLAAHPPRMPSGRGYADLGRFSPPIFFRHDHRRLLGAVPWIVASGKMAGFLGQDDGGGGGGGSDGGGDFGGSIDVSNLPLVPQTELSVFTPPPGGGESGGVTDVFGGGGEFPTTPADIGTQLTPPGLEIPSGGFVGQETVALPSGAQIPVPPGMDSTTFLNMISGGPTETTMAQLSSVLQSPKGQSWWSKFGNDVLKVLSHFSAEGGAGGGGGGSGPGRGAASFPGHPTQKSAAAGAAAGTSAGLSWWQQQFIPGINNSTLALIGGGGLLTIVALRGGSRRR